MQLRHPRRLLDIQAMLILLDLKHPSLPMRVMIINGLIPRDPRKNNLAPTTVPC